MLCFQSPYASKLGFRENLCFFNLHVEFSILKSICRRIKKNQPQIIELFNLSPHLGSQMVGLRLAFSQPLSPFAFLCSLRQVHALNPVAFLAFIFVQDFLTILSFLVLLCRLIARLVIQSCFML